MDPLTIFGAAANAAQCVDVTWRTLKGTHELYHSATGATKQQQVLLLITQSLQQTVDALSMSINSEGHNLTTKEENLEVLLKECRVVADGVIVKLNKLGMDSRSSNRKWASLLQSVRNQWAQSEMKEIESQLNSFRQQISVYLMVSIR